MILQISIIEDYTEAFAHFSVGGGWIFERDDALTPHLQGIPLKYLVSAVDLRVKSLSYIHKILCLVFVFKYLDLHFQYFSLKFLNFP